MTNNSETIFLRDFEVQDIDTDEDWAFAELKYKHMMDEK